MHAEGRIANVEWSRAMRAVRLTAMAITRVLFSIVGSHNATGRMSASQ